MNNQFRVRDIRSKDYSTYPIIITSNVTLHDSKGLSPRLPLSLTFVGAAIFPRHTKLGNTKTLAFKTSSDISFTVSYPPDVILPPDISPVLLRANITGVPDKIEKLKGTHECHDPTVKVNIKLVDAGLIEVVSSEAQCELHEKKNIADKFMGFFGGGKDSETATEEQAVFDEKTAETTAAAVDASEKVMFERGPLRVSVIDESPAYLTPEQKSASKKLYSPPIF